MEWRLEHYFLIFVHAVGITAFLCIPRHKRKEAHAVFLFQGMLTWILGLSVVEAGWLMYPIRELNEASSTSFVFEFLIFPVTAAYYNIFYPANQPVGKRFAWLLLFAAGITLPEYFIERYTDLLEYTGWSWYWTTLSISATLCISRLFFLWFFRRGQAYSVQ
ncbi:MAG: hypothetical protein K0R57_5381 [Paenibacillaceae bacterium]|jgi:hypothetical protein|nr:hypothetical protein [Paenibacillaceae bacterium]